MRQWKSLEKKTDLKIKALEVVKPITFNLSFMVISCVKVKVGDTVNIWLYSNNSKYVLCT